MKTPQEHLNIRIILVLILLSIFLGIYHFFLLYIFIWIIVVCSIFMRFFSKIITCIGYLHTLGMSTKLIDRCKFTSIIIFYNIPILVALGLYIEVNPLSMFVGIGTWWILIFLLVNFLRKSHPTLQKWIIAWLIIKQLLSIFSLSFLDIAFNSILYEYLIEPIGDRLYGWEWCFVRGGNDDFFPMFLGVFWNGVFVLLFSLICSILILNIGFLRKRFLDTTP